MAALLILFHIKSYILSVTCQKVASQRLKGERLRVKSQELQVKSEKSIILLVPCALDQLGAEIKCVKNLTRLRFKVISLGLFRFSIFPWFYV